MEEEEGIPRREVEEEGEEEEEEEEEEEDEEEEEEEEQGEEEEGEEGDAATPTSINNVGGSEKDGVDDEAANHAAAADDGAADADDGAADADDGAADDGDADDAVATDDDDDDDDESVEDSGVSASRLPPSPPRETADYMKAELDRVHRRLHNLTAPLKPQCDGDGSREFVPDTFHNYATYCDVSAAKIVVEQKNVQVLSVHRGHGRRPTALNIVEPQHNLRLDRQLMDKSSFAQKKLPPLGRIPTPDRFSRPIKEGSTMLPPVPPVSLTGHLLQLTAPTTGSLQPVKTIATKNYFRDGYDYSLNYPPTVMEKDRIRKLLNDRYEKHIRVDRSTADEEKTKADFFRMKLDVMKEVLPENRKRMNGAILTYLSTAEGSKKAVEECLHE